MLRSVAAGIFSFEAVIFLKDEVLTSIICFHLLGLETAFDDSGKVIQGIEEVHEAGLNLAGIVSVGDEALAGFKNLLHNDG